MRVGRANTDSLLHSLENKGYRPEVIRFTDHRNHLWYVVKLGPYRQWNTASAVAARISIAERLSPVIGPMR